MEQSTSSEANWFSASQEIPRILSNPNVHYRNNNNNNNAIKYWSISNYDMKSNSNGIWKSSVVPIIVSARPFMREFENSKLWDGITTNVPSSVWNMPQCNRRLKLKIFNDFGTDRGYKQREHPKEKIYYKWIRLNTRFTTETMLIKGKHWLGYTTTDVKNTENTSLITIRQEFNKNYELHSTYVSMPLRPEQSEIII